VFVKPATQHAQLLKELVAQGIVFSVRANALKGIGFSKESLPDFTTVVPAGVVELIKKQEEGCAYIKSRQITP
jgi:Uncharacterized conserved protein